MNFFEKKQTIFIDEAQRIKNIGLTLKIIIDQLKPRQIFVTGSSSLELANEINEPLTERKWEYMLFPISWGELQEQVGNEVTFNELAGLVQVDKNTIQTYLDLLEKAFVIFRLQPLSRNLRNEISSNRKIYFYDNGIRNSLISNFNPLNIRTDTGSLWEKYLISERKKTLEYNRIFTNTYFWRTTYKQELDYIEERDGKLFAFEFKWNPNKKARIPEKFLKAYPHSESKVISQENFHEFLLNK